MNGSWGVVGGIAGSFLGAAALIFSGWFAARAAKAAAKTTAEAQRAVAEAAAEPQQRQADLAAFREIREGLDRRLERSERRIDSLTTLVRAYAWYVADLTGLMRRHGIEPPEPPERVREYDRTGV
jgi:DNA repair ATPase RecN